MLPAPTIRSEVTRATYGDIHIYITIEYQTSKFATKRRSFIRFDDPAMAHQPSIAEQHYRTQNFKFLDKSASKLNERCDQRSLGRRI